MGLDWIHDFKDWIGLGQQKWTHVQLWGSEAGAGPTTHFVENCGRMSIVAGDKEIILHTFSKR